MNSLEKKALIKASSHVLMEQLPEYFEEWEDLELNYWMEDHAAQDYEGWHAMALWEAIEDLSTMIIDFHEEQKQKVYATFNIADQEVTIWSEEEFGQWINELISEIEYDGENHKTMDINEILEYFWDDEVWYGEKVI